MPDALQTGGIGGAGALFGAILTWAGFKSRLDRLESEAVTKETCLVCKQGARAMDAERSKRMDRVESSIERGFAEIHRRLDDLNR